jgi:hypothetical protein
MAEAITDFLSAETAEENTILLGKETIKNLTENSKELNEIIGTYKKLFSEA